MTRSCIICTSNPCGIVDPIKKEFKKIAEGCSKYLDSSDPPNYGLCIDPGHGGSATGATKAMDDGIMVSEKDLNLQIASLLYSHVQEFFKRVTMTRYDDSSPASSQRVRISNTFSSNVFVSIHCNSSVRNNPRGIELWIYRRSRGGRFLANCIKEQLISEFPHRTVRVLQAYHPYKYKENGKSKTWKKEIAVLRDTACPAVLVECGYMTNPIDMDALLMPVYQRQLTKAICLGIDKFSAPI